MPFSYRLSEHLQVVLIKVSKRNPSLAAAVYKKIRQIVDLNDETTIDHFKNLRHGLSDYKRVHVGHFVLFFQVLKKEKFILFVKLDHHDDAY